MFQHSVNIGSVWMAHWCMYVDWRSLPRALRGRMSIDVPCSLSLCNVERATTVASWRHEREPSRLCGGATPQLCSTAKACLCRGKHALSGLQGTHGPVLVNSAGGFCDGVHLGGWVGVRPITSYGWAGFLLAQDPRKHSRAHDGCGGSTRRDKLGVAGAVMECHLAQPRHKHLIWSKKPLLGIAQRG